jgi:hypothetical protein
MEFSDAIATARNAAENFDFPVYILDERGDGWGFQVYAYPDRSRLPAEIPVAAVVYPDGRIELEPEYER